MKTSEELDKELTQFKSTFDTLKGEIQKAIVGYDDLITDTMVAIFSQGHVLLEGVPGLGKTFLVKIISEVLGLESGRVQCTPDLMPADILGTQIVNENEDGRRMLHFEKGPVFKNLHKHGPVDQCLALLSGEDAPCPLDEVTVLNEWEDRSLCKNEDGMLFNIRKAHLDS